MYAESLAKFSKEIQMDVNIVLRRFNHTAYKNKLIITYATFIPQLPYQQLTTRHLFYTIVKILK